MLYVFPDSVCEKLLGVMQNRYIMTKENLSYADAQSLTKVFTRDYPEESADSGVQYSIRTKTMQVNSLLGSNFVLKAAMNYGAIVLMVICLTVLSLQQLLDAAQNKYRFFVLRQLGVSEKNIGHLILKQLGAWFGFPILLAILISGVVIGGFFQTITAEIDAYIGWSALMVQVAATASILALLLTCYFISTWILFRRSIDEGK